MQAFAVAGLLLDIVGAAVLAIAVFARNPQRTQQESASGYGYNVDLHMALATQTADARAGVLLLATGFVGQGVSAAGLNPQSGWARASIIGVAALLALAGVALLRL